jgi:hypothetical protein
MRAMRRCWGVLAGLAIVLVAVAPGAQGAVAASFEIAGGTWVAGPSGQLMGPAWELDGPTATFGATVTGPNGFSRHIGGVTQRFPGMPSTRSIHWCQPAECTLPSSAASWLATGDDNSQLSFPLDVGSRLTPVAIVANGFHSATVAVSASWTAGTDAQSFIAYLQPANSTSATAWTAGQILPGSARSVTFTGLALDRSTLYSLDLFAFSGDIAGQGLPQAFNMASDRLDFRPGQVGRPNTLFPIEISPATAPLAVVSSAPWHLPDPQFLTGGAPAGGRQVQFTSRPFFVDVLLQNRSQTRIGMILDATTPEPPKALLLQDRLLIEPICLEMLGPAEGGLCDPSQGIAPGQEVIVRLIYRFVSCHAALRASTKTAEHLVITYRYGPHGVRHQTFPIGAARLLPRKPTASGCR